MNPQDTAIQPAERMTDRKREAIVQAAIAEFRAQGFQLTSMDRVAARAEVSKRTVYNHFPSKEALFTDILERLWASSQVSEELAYQPGKALEAQLLALMLAKLALLANPSFLDLARVAIAETIHSPERTGEVLARFGEREEHLTTWIRAAQADGQLQTTDPALAGQQLHALVKAFAFWPQVTMGQLPLTEAEQQSVAASAVAMFLARYGRGTPT